MTKFYLGQPTKEQQRGDSHSCFFKLCFYFLVFISKYVSINKKSGYEFRRERDRKIKAQEEVVQKTAKIHTFFEKTKTNNVNRFEENEDEQCNYTLQSNVDRVVSAECESTLDTVKSYKSIPDDPSKWDRNDDVFLINLVRHQRMRDVHQLDFSKSKKLFDHFRYCSHKFFEKKHINGEGIQREWIFYSQTMGKMFCVYCQLFSEKRNGLFVDKGFDNWKHPHLIETHETSTSHFAAARIFVKRTSSASDVCSKLTEEIEHETSYWTNILKRVVSVVRFLTSRGLAFRGNSNRIGNRSNGNYLGLLELLSEYDKLLEAHIKKHANKGRGHVSYLSHVIANEFIHVLAEEVRNVIINEIRISKYFALIVDSTPDVSHLDQLTIVLRYVDQMGKAFERFIEFLPNTGHKGKEMETVVTDFLATREINILDCRGQAYDNAANMSGKFIGLQARIKEINPLAVYVSCEAHSLNLAVCHAAESSEIAVHFFLFIQNVYVFFSQSTHRWDILIRHLQDDLRERNVKDERLLVPKKLCGTRWCERADSCRAIKAGYGSFIKALKEISENVAEKKVTSIEAKALCEKFLMLENAILVEFWSAVLHRVKTTSKSIQDPLMDIEKSILLHNSLINYFEKLRNDKSFKYFEDKGRKLIIDSRSGMGDDLDLTYNCYYKRTRKRNTRFDDGSGPDTVFEGSDSFRIGSFFTSLDSILNDLRSYTRSYEETMKPFAFLTLLESHTSSDQQLRTGADKLRSIYCEDLDEGLYDECHQFKVFMEDIHIEMALEEEEMRNRKGCIEDEEGEYECRKPTRMYQASRMLQYIKKTKIEASFPNLCTALRIFETIAVCNASGERSFSALKRVKGPLRSAETQESLNDLSMLYINSDVLERIDCDEVIRAFAKAKARRKTFQLN